jgi:hypothetical protein
MSEKQGLIYDPTALSRIEDLLTKQEEQFVKYDKSSESQNKKIIRYAVVFGISVVSILLIKIILKKKK